MRPAINSLGAAASDGTLCGLQKEAEEGCARELVEGGKPGPHCSRLEALERLTYELIGQGQVRCAGWPCGPATAQL